MLHLMFFNYIYNANSAMKWQLHLTIDKRYNQHDLIKINL